MAGRGAGAAPQRIEDEFYKVLNKFNNKNWLQFARNRNNGLGLVEFQIDDIKSDYPNDAREQKYQMLSLWKRRNSSIATIPYLNQLADEFLHDPNQPNLEGGRNPEQVVDDVEHQVPAPENRALRGREQSNLSSLPQVPAQNKIIVGSNTMAPVQASNDARDAPHPSGNNLDLRQRILTPVSQLPVQDNKSVESGSMAQVHVSGNDRNILPRDEHQDLSQRYELTPRCLVQHTESDVDSSASTYASNNFGSFASNDPRSSEQNYLALMSQDHEQGSIVSNTSRYIHSDESLRQASDISKDFQTDQFLPRVNRAYSSYEPNLAPRQRNLLMCPANNMDSAPTSIEVHRDISLPGRAYAEEVENWPAPISQFPGIMHSVSNLDLPQTYMQIQRDLSLPNISNTDEDNFGPEFTANTEINSQSSEIPHCVEDGNRAMLNSYFGYQGNQSEYSRPGSSRQKLLATPSAGANRPQTIVYGQRSTPNVHLPFPSPFSLDFSNAQINVTGRHATGVQVNTRLYSGPSNLSVPKLPSTKDYCLEVERIDVISSDKAFYEEHLTGNQSYRITHTPKGVVLIVYNPVYEDETETCRMDKDIRNIETMWEKFGCKTHVRTNSTANEIRSTLKKFADSRKAAQCDFVVVIILGSGDLLNGGTKFPGTDDNKVDVIEILETFSDKNAKKLRGIPKLFFLQFNEPNSELQNCLFSEMPGMMMSYVVQCSRDRFYNVDGGSWYINAIVHTFMNHAHSHHIEDVMDMVENAMTKKKMKCTSKVRCSSKSTLLKKLYLFPGFPEDVADEFD